MKRLFIFLTGFLVMINSAQALQVTQKMKTRIGIFDACEQSLTYAFYRDKDYDIKTTLKTTGTFGALYPFSATYHAVGTYNGSNFKPQDYFYETQSRFSHRTKEITYKDGIPQLRISVKDGKKAIMAITINPKYDRSIDLLSVFGVLIEQIVRTGKCDFESHSFNGKKYSLSKVTKIKSEKIKTDFFEGKADKCQYSLEVLDDADAGFLIKNGSPVYMWIMYDKQTKAPFVAKIEVPSTPFGKLQAITTSVEVKK